MNKHTPQSILDKLQSRADTNMLRGLMDAGDLIDFFSNDYLGLSKVKTDSHCAEGSTGSRLISGNSFRTETIEAELAEFFEQEAGIFFNSGYDANLGFYSSVPQRGDTVIYDELIHASIRDGIKLGNANSFSFKHNDPNHLIEKIKRAKGSVFVAIESIYSMDGDQSPLTEIVNICEHYNCYLVVDEAHSGGLFGEKGQGLVHDYCLDKKVFAKLVTFGKAYGSHGAIFFGSKELKQYLVNFARSLIYSTSLPLQTQERNFEMVMKASEMKGERLDLRKKVSYFKDKLTEDKYSLIESESPIQSLVIGDREEAKSLELKLRKNGFAAKAILSPTVPEETERLRFCLHSYNTFEEIDAISNIING